VPIPRCVLLPFRHAARTDWNVKEPIPASLTVALPILEGAADEDRDELADLWARHLANTLDPSLNTVRHWFIDAVKKMDPPDAIVLVHMYEQGIAIVNIGQHPLQNQTTGVVNIAQSVGRKPDEIEVSLRHLAELRFFDSRPGNPGVWITDAVYRRFIQACYPEIA
jgi:hypothetical protein